MTEPRPTVRLTIEDPGSLRAVEQWAELARAVGMPDTAPVQVTVTGHLIASAFLNQLDVIA